MARFLNRVRLENYKSIAHCDVELKDLTFLVGPNGAGKSNFLSSLDLLRDIIIISIPEARNVWMNNLNIFRHQYNHINAQFSGIFGDVYLDINKNLEAVIKKNDPINFNMHKINNQYNFAPENLKDPSRDSETYQLSINGDNLPNTLSKIITRDPNSFIAINNYIHLINPDILKISFIQVGGYDILQFHCEGSDTPFNASQMSDGTLHALGVLTAIFHAKSAGIPLIGIEEPEAGLHPAAARVMREALIEASKDVQIIVTSHSPDLLDSPDIDPDSILAVVRENGETKIGPIDAASRQALKEHLFTAGELLRMNQLEPAA